MLKPFDWSKKENVKRLRVNYVRLNQPMFAARIGAPLDTLKGWESGRSHIISTPAGRIRGTATPVLQKLDALAREYHFEEEA